MLAYYIHHVPELYFEKINVKWNTNTVLVLNSDKSKSLTILTRLHLKLLEKFQNSFQPSFVLHVSSCLRVNHMREFFINKYS